jgi:hypothetical protein
MSRKVRFLSAITAGVLLLASCGGGGDSSSRTKNSALCYETQEIKDAAVKTAQERLEAAMSGASSGDDNDETPTSTIEETPTTILQSTSTTISQSTSTTISQKTSTSLEGASGGGYRRPAVRATSSGDTTVPPAGGGDALTPEQQQAQMELEAAEAQPVCEADGAVSDERTCDITLNGIGQFGGTSTCEEVVVEIVDTRATFAIEWIATVGSQTVASGTWDSVSENTKVVSFTYTPEATPGSGNGDEENSADDCTAIFTSTGVSWDCPNGELFNAAIEDMSNRGVYPLVECSASGSFTVAENQQFWFNFSLGGTFFDGYNNWQEQNVAIEFTVPEDTEGVCSGSDSDGESDSDEIDWESLPFSGESDIQVVRYSFTVPEDLGGPVLARFESTEYFDVDIDGADDFDSAPCDDECPPYVGFSNWELAPGEYFIEINEHSETVSWVSNVEINPVPLSIGDLPFSYTSDGSQTEYLLGLEEDQTVTLFATAGQTCLPSEADEEGNGFADPYLTLLFGNGERESDDNSGHSAGNCSASFMEIELDAGTYTIYVEDGDEEGGSITLSSNVELQPVADLEWNYENQDVVNESAIEFVVPDGGAWFRATTYTNQSLSFTLRNYDYAQPVDSGGCANPDGDFSTDDDNCVWTGLELFFEEGGSISGDWAGSSTWSDDGELQLVTHVNSGGSKIEYFLPEGIYQLAAWGGTPDGTDANFRLEYGFGSSIEMKEKLIDVPPLSANPSTVELPVRSANPSTVELPVSSLDQGSQIAIAVSASVEEFVCDSVCIDTLFANAGLTDGSISISAGADAVTIQKGQNRAVIPVSKGADRISAQGISADGATVVNLGSKIAQLPPDVLAAIESKTATGTSGGGSSINWLLVAAIGFIVVAGVALAVLRKKKLA